MRRPTIFLMLAMVAAVLAGIVVFSALRSREAQVQMAMAQTEEIVVAARDVQLGEKLELGDVKLVRWSRQSVPQGAFTDPAAAVNSYTRNQLIAGEPLIEKNLVTSDKVPGVMPLIIPPGMRAMSVAVDEVSDIAGFVKPHTRVDVLVAVAGSGSGNGPENKPFSKIVLQDIEVLAVAQQIDKGKDEAEVAKVVTLVVTPHQAEKLGLASHEGVLRLAMRNYSDDKVVATSGSDFSDLLGTSAPVIALNAQSAEGPMAEPMRSAGGFRAHQFAVEIMRDGKSAETVSFVSANAGDNHAAVHTEPAIAAAAMPPTTVVPAQPRAAASAPAVTGAAAPSNPMGTASFMPVPKTLEVP